MMKKAILGTALFVSLLTTDLLAGAITSQELKEVNGNWHLRVADGHDVKRARAIVDFHAQQMVLDGFDGCNRISGHLKAQGPNLFYAKLHSKPYGMQTEHPSLHKQTCQSSYQRGVHHYQRHKIRY